MLKGFNKTAVRRGAQSRATIRSEFPAVFTPKWALSSPASWKCCSYPWPFWGLYLLGVFRPQVLKPGETVHATFVLTWRDLSYWGPASGPTPAGWVRAMQGLTAHFAASSCDRRASLALKL